MEPRRFSQSLDWFYIISLVAVYFLGAAYARRYSSELLWANLICGFGILGTTYFSGLTQVWSNRNRSYERDNRSLRGSPLNTRILIFFLMGMAFAFLYALLRQEVLIGVNLIWILGFGFFSFFSAINSGIMPRNFLSWILDGFALSPFALLLGAGTQELEPNPRLILLSAAVLLFYLSAALVLHFNKLCSDIENERQVVLVGMGWQRGAHLVLVLSLSGFLTLAAYAYFSGTFSAIWPAFGLLIASLIQAVLFRQMDDGVKPNLPLLSAMSIIQFFGIIYILILTMFA